MLTHTPIKLIREKRADILGILLTAVLLASAINLITAYFSILFESSPSTLLISGLIFLLLGFLLLARNICAPSEYVIRLNGAVAFQKNGQSVSPVQIYGYEFNDDFCEFLQAFLQENKAYGKIFSTGEIRPISLEKFDPDNLNTNTIINSVLEYTVLHQLHLHLNAYFSENEIDPKRIVTLSREEVGTGVLKNRVLEQLTKDMKERPAFADEEEDNETECVIAYAPGKDGSIYHRFELELPPKSTISRDKNGFLAIDNSLFELKILPQFEGFNTNVASVLMSDHPDFFAPLLARVKLHIRVKQTAFVTSESMEMYEWLDSFVERMQKYVSVDYLEEKLNPSLISLLKK